MSFNRNEPTKGEEAHTKLDTLLKENVANGLSAIDMVMKTFGKFHGIPDFYVNLLQG